MSVSLSVVIPVRDDAVHLSRCLRLLQEQTCQPEEVIVVDNASTDGSGKVATAAGARVVHEPLAGIPAAAAAGYDAAGGDVIVRCDADTAPPPQWLARVKDAFEQDDDLAALTGPGRFYDLPPVRARLAEVVYMRGYYWGVHAALAGVPLWGSNMAMRRACWQALSAHMDRADARLHDDIDLSFRLDPALRVRYDRQLVVGVAGRTFHSRAAMYQRLDKAVHTLAVNWGQVPPWARWQRRLTLAAGAGGPTGSRPRSAAG